VVFSYYFCAWFAVGRDPKSGAAIPLYRPPDGISPGFARYLLKMKCTEQNLMAELLHLAVKGVLYFEDGESRTTIKLADTAKGGGDNMSGLPDYLMKLIGILFSEGGRASLEVDKSNGHIFFNANNHLKDSYERMGKPFFTTNSIFFKAGLALFLPILIIGPLIGRGGPKGAFICYGGLMLAGVIFLIFRRTPFSKDLMFSVLSFVYLAFIVFILFNWVFIESLVLSIAVVSFFYRVMPVRTAAGVKVAAELEGLIMYMKTAESSRFENLNSPSESPAVYETLLPYAFALDCADTWVDKFSDILQKTTYFPKWVEYAVTDSSGRTDYIFVPSHVASEVGFSITSYANSLSNGSSSGSAGV
jgi:hypothetical protein